MGQLAVEPVENDFITLCFFQPILPGLSQRPDKFKITP